jgi:hypothetical protein
VFVQTGRARFLLNRRMQIEHSPKDAHAPGRKTQGIVTKLGGTRIALAQTSIGLEPTPIQSQTVNERN